MSAEPDPGAIADGLEGVLASADMALTDDEIEYIGEAIGYLRREARRRDGVRDKLDRAFNGGGA